MSPQEKRVVATLGALALFLAVIIVGGIFVLFLV